ncbi:hypothetical protein Tco_0016838 [Tanacetum coccineum]
MEILLEPTSNKLLVGLDDNVAALFQQSRIHKPHTHTHAFKVNHSTSKSLILNFPTIKEPQSQRKNHLFGGDIDEAGLPPFVCKIGKSKRNKKIALENFQLYYSDMGPSLSNGKPLTQEEATREALTIDICKRFSILKEKRPVFETMAYKEVIKQFKGEALKEKEDPGAFIILIRLEAKINLNALANTGLDINVMPYRLYMKLAKTSLNTKESDNDDEEDYGIQRNNFGAPITYDDEAGSFSSRPKRARIAENVEEALMGRVFHEFLLSGIIGTFLTLGCGNAIGYMLELDEAVADDELMTKKEIKFRLCGKAYAISLRNDGDFNVDRYWLNISSEEILTLSRSSAKTIRKPVLRVEEEVVEKQVDSGSSDYKDETESDDSSSYGSTPYGSCHEEIVDIAAKKEDTSDDSEGGYFDSWSDHESPSRAMARLQSAMASRTLPKDWCAAARLHKQIAAKGLDSILRIIELVSGHGHGSDVPGVWFCFNFVEYLSCWCFAHRVQHMALIIEKHVLDDP